MLCPERPASADKKAFRPPAPPGGARSLRLRQDSRDVLS
jgi:hypothetical protein